MSNEKYYLSSNENGLSFYNANYCIKCLCPNYYKKHIFYQSTDLDSIEKYEGFLCTCEKCEFTWLAPIDKKAYYTLEAAEQLECIKLFLDKANVPTHDEDSKPYSYVGRIEQFAMSYAKNFRKLTDFE